MELTPVPVQAKDEEAALHLDVTSTLENKDSAEELINSKPVVVISKSTCPFCFELKRTLRSYGVYYEVAEIDLVPSMSNIQKNLLEKYGVCSVPLLFLNGELIGGCTKVKELELSGEFQRKIHPFVTADVPAENRVNRFTLLYFPETVNKRVVRAVGVLTALYCIFCVAFFNRPATKYAVLGLAIDFLLRIIFGSGFSPVGMVGAALVAPFDPIFAAGAPKQFAACCGFFMSALSAALLLSGQELGGTIVVGMLIFPASLEGVFDFCLGCWMFGMAIDYNLIPASIYRPYLNYFPAKKWAHEFSSGKKKFAEATASHVLMPGQTVESPVDLIRKDRYETEYKLQDIHVKNITVDFFAFPMSAGGLAMVFKFVADMEREGISSWDTEIVYNVLGIFSAALFGALSLVYLYKLVVYPKKIEKEWNHPIFGNFYAAVTICITIYGVLLYDNELTGGVALVWIGSVIQLTWTVLRVADLLYGRIGTEMITPAVMFTPLGNVLSALAFAWYPTYSKAETGDVNYYFVARLWFAVGVVMGAVYFFVSLQKAILDHHSDQRLRSLLWVWMAAFALTGPAYLAVTEANGQAAVERGVLYHTLFCFAVFLFAVNSIGFLRAFYTYVADMSIWMVPFACSALSLNAVQYYSVTGGNFTMMVAIIIVSITCTSATVCFGYTMMWALDMSLFRPRVKWGPVSFMKLTHETFRFAFPIFERQLDSLLESRNSLNNVAVEHFLADMDALFLTYTEHGAHEEKVLFPTLRRFHPKLNPSMDEEHEYEHSLLATMQSAIAAYKAGDRSPADMVQVLQDLKQTFPDFSSHVLDHLRNEESTITVVARKYLTVDLQRENLPHPMWKVRFIRTFIWGKPDRAQEIGLLCYRTLNSVDWEFLSKEIPEMIPRGVKGWVRQY